MDLPKIVLQGGVIVLPAKALLLDAGTRRFRRNGRSDFEETSELGGIRLSTSSNHFFAARANASWSHFVMCGRSFSFSEQTDSATSLSGTKISVYLMLKTRVNILGSSSVIWRSKWPKSRRW
jgi:hypothetical protein